MLRSKGVIYFFDLFMGEVCDYWLVCDIYMLGFMADQGFEGSQPVDLQKHPSGIVPTLQWVSIDFDFNALLQQYLNVGL